VRALLDAECTADKVEQDGTWCQEAMGSILNAMAKKIRISTSSKRRWKAIIIKRWKAVESWK
jgi:hypothetical protein